MLKKLNLMRNFLLTALSLSLILGSIFIVSKQVVYPNIIRAQNLYDCTQQEADSGNPSQACQKDGCKGFKHPKFEFWEDTNGNGEKDQTDSFKCNFTECSDLYDCQSNNPIPSPTSKPTTSEVISYCKDNPISPPSGYFWAAYCDKICSDFNHHNDCSKNTSDPAVNPETSNWCYGFKEGGRCLKLVTQKDPTTHDSQRLSKVTNGTKISTSSDKTANTPTSNNLTPTLPTQTQTCEDATNAFYDAKTQTRFTQYLTIIKGIPSMCVKADLGIDPQLTATSEVSGKTGRLYLCSGAESTSESLVLKWRVDTGTGELEPITENYSTSLESLVNKDQVQKAESLIQ